MLKFTEIFEDNREEICNKLFEGDGDAAEVLWSLELDDPDVSYAVTGAFDCILIRIFDLGRYLFVYPIARSDAADVSSAILAVSEYAMREELPLVFTDAPGEDVAVFAELGFRHIELDAEDDGIYKVRIRTECELLSEVPEFDIDGLHITALGKDDESAYAELCRDPELNRFWGYDYREDEPDASDEFFYTMQEQGFLRGASVTLALRKDGELVGITELFAFDGRGGAECAVKIARAYHGRGYGSLGVKAAIEAAQRMSLKRLFCDVMKGNVRSVKMVRKYFKEVKSAFSDRLRFETEI